MLLTITATHHPATDLGYLLHKHPERIQVHDLAFGRAHIFYPEANTHRCTAALLVEIDPIALVRRNGKTAGSRVFQYVNDRPYAASSFLSVAIARVYGTALAGKSEHRPELAAAAIPLTARIAVLPCRGGEGLLRRLFEPLGYRVTADGHALDDRFPQWGQSDYFTVTLEATVRLSELLMHLYVLVPVLDDEKHYWVGDDEVEKLLRHGGDWLAAHPELELIVRRYLKHQRRLTRMALDRLLDEDQFDPDNETAQRTHEEEAVERPVRLHEQRIEAVTVALNARGARRVLDLGCGEGRLLKELLGDASFEEIVGVDVSPRALDVARERLNLDRLPPRRRDRVRLLQGSLTYRDKRLTGYDAAAVLEVIEHFEPYQLSAFEGCLFEHARPATIILTTPNVEYNVKFESLPPGRFRHRDHRFEWTRREFQSWARRVGARCGYSSEFHPVGPEDPVLGPPTQMVIMSRVDTARSQEEPSSRD